jgi:hypothetical protein
MHSVFFLSFEVQYFDDPMPLGGTNLDSLHLGATFEIHNGKQSFWLELDSEEEKSSWAEVFLTAIELTKQKNKLGRVPKIFP